MHSENDFIPLSALQHFVFCRRQCALIHIEQIWEENLWTAEGRIMHDNVHEERMQTKKGVRIERGVALCSAGLGLSGKADVVEFYRDKAGGWIVFPVEYKRGRPKPSDCDRVQLCAQTICLEEMIGARISSGAIFYGRTRRREDVVFDNILREKTQTAAKEAHRFIRDGRTPPPRYAKRCESCSLLDLCMPKRLGSSSSVEGYIEKMLRKDEKIT